MIYPFLPISYKSRNVRCPAKVIGFELFSISASRKRPFVFSKTGSYLGVYFNTSLL